jgi:hypothetical protein
MFINQSEWRSVCKQETRYTYAIVKDFNSTDEYRIDYMKINSGCSCTILGPAKPAPGSPHAKIHQEHTGYDIFNKMWHSKNKS